MPVSATFHNTIFDIRCSKCKKSDHPTYCTQNGEVYKTCNACRARDKERRRARATCLGLMRLMMMMMWMLSWLCLRLPLPLTLPLYLGILMMLIFLAWLLPLPLCMSPYLLPPPLRPQPITLLMSQMLSLSRMVAKGFKGLGLKKSLKACGLLIVSMESIAEVKIVSVKYQCSSSNVIRDEDQFVKCVGKCDTCKTCQICRDTKKKYRYKVKASKVILVDDVLSVSSSSSAC